MMQSNDTHCSQSTWAIVRVSSFCVCRNRIPTINFNVFCYYRASASPFLSSTSISLIAQFQCTKVRRNRNRMEWNESNKRQCTGRISIRRSASKTKHKHTKNHYYRLITFICFGFEFVKYKKKGETIDRLNLNWTGRNQVI